MQTGLILLSPFLSVFRIYHQTTEKLVHHGLVVCGVEELEISLLLL
jgi:hypothetical protein